MTTKKVKQRKLVIVSKVDAITHKFMKNHLDLS